MPENINTRIIKHNTDDALFLLSFVRSHVVNYELTDDPKSLYLAKTNLSQARPSLRKLLEYADIFSEELDDDN